MLRSLTEIERAIRASWSAETCDPADLPWSDANPSSGQCSVTALVVHDLLGGELLLADVHNPDGSRQGFHYWNRLHGGYELDLTREQFSPAHAIGTPEVVRPPEDRTRGRMADQYARLSAAVHVALGNHSQ